MDDLTAFLNARIDEDDAVARQAAQVAGPDWTWKTEVPEGGDYPTDYIKTPGGTPLLDTMGGIEGDAPHVARHDPARVLREVAAKRAILAEHAPRAYDRYGRIGIYCRACVTGHEPYMDDDTPDSWPCATVRHLAAVWGDHPDYRPEWKPEPLTAGW
jgi:Family of unknown function (DUF6221)